MSDISATEIMFSGTSIFIECAGGLKSCHELSSLLIAIQSKKFTES